jgi:hypothetical protein
VPVDTPSSALTRGQLLRLRLRAWDRRTWVLWTLVLVLAEGRGALQSGQDYSWLPAVLAPVALVLYIPLMAGSVATYRRTMRLEATSPAAVRAIRDGLTAAGLPVPDQLFLGPLGSTAARFSAFPRRRARLYLALPQLLAQPVSDLAVLAASAMAVGRVTAHPASAQRLWRKRVTLEARRQALTGRGRPTGGQARRIDAFLAATESFARDVRAASDQAAVIAAGSVRAAARARYSEMTVNADFSLYGSRFRRLISRKRQVPGSIHAGWFAQWADAPQWLQAGTLCPVDSFHEGHPGLRAFERDDFVAQIGRLRAGQAGPPAPSTPSPRVTRRLARLAARQFTPAADSVRAVEGAKIDLRYVYAENAEDADILTAATALLSRRADRVDVVELFRDGRGPELAAALLAPDEIEADDADCGLNRGMVFATLLISALRAHGMRQSDPYRELLFTGHDGEQIDVARIVTEALPPQGDPDRLCSLLRG